MRIAATSDIHIDKNGQGTLDALADRVRALAPDVLVIAGDIATAPTTFLSTLLALRAAAPELVVIAGNHDVWSGPAAVKHGIDAWARLDKILPALCNEAGARCLDAGPVVIGGIGFAGTLGWYDLSTRDMALDAPEEAYRTGAYAGMQWMDHRLAIWTGAGGEPMSERAVAERLRNRFAAHLAQLKTAAIVAVTHMLPFAEQVHRKQHPGWRFANAFMGHLALGDVIRADPRVRLAIAGHTHLPSENAEGPLHTLVTPLGYHTEWAGRSAVEAVERAVRVVELVD